MESDLTHARAARMVDRLGPLPAAVAEVMRRVPRERFVPDGFRDVAYEDTPIPLPFGDATISAPHMVALQLEWAELAPGHRVLEIGAGFGYLAALIAELVGPTGAVCAIEIEPALTREAARRLAASASGRAVRLRNSDGRAGWPDAGPFDRIIVSCAVGDVPWVWFHSLTADGLLVAPLGDALGQRLARWKNSRVGGSWEYGVSCRFVPLRTVLPSDI
ncbi:MAG: methyltransferase domain-containing protein [Thermoplasmata archaeon]|nr:methyltransferase domain-containing protein [Thermoplasmata archaeon]